MTVAKEKRKTKAETLQEAIAAAIGAGRELHMKSVDFSDPNRPKTCLEVDFPILPINHVAAIEGNAGKPIYQMSKWWARRRSSVFRAMLIAGATKAPDDPAEAAKLVWDAYYGNHQENKSFHDLKVADIFMGGGTTIVEGARLGMQMYGNDLNPVAWFVVKNELAQVQSDNVRALLDHVEAAVKPQIMPFYACDCPRGHIGKWTKKSTGKVMGTDFSPLSLSQQERPDYQYDGPEVIYTFWSKHGPCQGAECNHRTPIMSTPVIAVKVLTVKAWLGRQCRKCGDTFDVERHHARMAPGAQFVISPDEVPYSVMDDAGIYTCPHCGHGYQDEAAAANGHSSQIGKSKNKSIELTLLVHPEWLKGAPQRSSDGLTHGGCNDDPVETTRLWEELRAQSLVHIEFRGSLPNEFSIPNQKEPIKTGKAGGTIPKPSHFTCAECGTANDVLDSMTRSGKSGPIAEYAVQGYCPDCDALGLPYNGRFFTLPTASRYMAAYAEWSVRSQTDLAQFWPKEQLPEGYKTTYQRIPEHGYPRFVDMSNRRQLLVLSQLLKAIVEGPAANEVQEFVLSAFQQYLRNQNMFCIWNVVADKLEPMFSNNYYHPKPTVVENCVFAKLGRGNWSSTSSNCFDVIRWKEMPWDVVAKSELEREQPSLADAITGKSTKIVIGDALTAEPVLSCGSASSLSTMPSGDFDLVITDPPFGNNIQYAELADYFYVWLKLALKDRYKYFTAPLSPKSLEAVVNPVRNPSDPDGFYQKMLTECWREALRILKPGGILAFTFHHSEDEPWVAVLESLFQAGFYLEGAYPIRSDETKGDGGKPGTFGSQLIEYDIIHVCRKRVEQPQEISWARLRKQILRDVRQLQEILGKHQKDGLLEADLQVIRRGKALEYYSRHYGKVYIEKGREDDFTVKDALVGINQLLDDVSDTTTDAPPALAEPYTRQFLRLFADSSSIARDQLQKHLRGTGVSPSEFLERGWCREEKKVFIITPPLEWAQKWKGVSRKTMSRDFDQTYFLIGASYDESGIKVSDTLNSGSFVPHPATSDLLDWFGKHGSDSDTRAAAQRAKQIYSAWKAKNKPQVEAQLALFDIDGGA